VNQIINPRLTVILPICGALSLLLAWQFLLPLAGVPSYIVPTPFEIGRVMLKEQGLLWGNFWPTLQESLLGFLIGNGTAIILAVIFVHHRYLQAAYFPVILFLNTIPILALAPVIILMFGLGMAPKVVIAAVICFFPTLVNTIRGLESITPNELELFRILSASPFETLWRLRLPRAVPFLFSSLRISSATAVIGSVVGEWIGSDKGLGAMIIQATFNYQSGRLYAAIVMCSSLSIGLFSIIAAAEKIALHYEK
jgi:NitT/TauT family transport system permease protein